MKKSLSYTGGPTAAISVLVAFALAAGMSIIGWVINIVAFFAAINAPWNGLEIARLVGIPVPFLGALLGWFA